MFHSAQHEPAWRFLPTGDGPIRGRLLNIGQAAIASGVSTRTIRHYERIGLVPAAPRGGSGYRIYCEADVATLRFLRRGRDLGFSVVQLRELLSLWRDAGRTSADVKRIALAQLRSLERNIAGLEAKASTLRRLAGACVGDDRPDCPIVDELASVADDGVDRRTRGRHPPPSQDGGR